MLEYIVKHLDSSVILNTLAFNNMLEERRLYRAIRLSAEIFEHRADHLSVLMALGHVHNVRKVDYRSNIVLLLAVIFRKRQIAVIKRGVAQLSARTNRLKEVERLTVQKYRVPVLRVVLIRPLTLSNEDIIGVKKHLIYFIKLIRKRLSQSGELRKTILISRDDLLAARNHHVAHKTSRRVESKLVFRVDPRVSVKINRGTFHQLSRFINRPLAVSDEIVMILELKISRHLLIEHKAV